jgi:DNA-binding NarL/FixJ family response regulator
MDGPAGECPLRVLVVDDHDLFRTGLRALLEEEGFEVADSTSAEAALRRLASFAPDVVVMDLNMPGMSGIEATPGVLDAAPNAFVLMLTIDTDDARVLEAIHAGASGYLRKDAELAEIVSGIRAVAAGMGALAPDVAAAVLTSVRGNAPHVHDESPQVVLTLSSREREVLGLLTRGYDNGAIARRLFVSPSTVKHHVSRLLAKIGAGNRVQAATFAVRTGLHDGTEPLI